MVSLRLEQETAVPREVRKLHADFLLNQRLHGKYQVSGCSTGGSQTGRGSLKEPWAPVAASASLFKESPLFLVRAARMGAVREPRSSLGLAELQAPVVCSNPGQSCSTAHGASRLVGARASSQATWPSALLVLSRECHMSRTNQGCTDLFIR